MAIDITTLSVQVKSKGIDDTAKSLDTLTKNAEKAEKSVENLEKRFQKSSTAIDAIKNSFMSMKDTMSKAFPTSGAVELNKALAQIAGTLNSINAKNIKINFGNVGADAEVARKGVASLNRSLMEGHNVFQVVGKSLYSLRNLLGGTMLAGALAGTTSEVIKMADSWALMGARLRLFSDSARDAYIAQERLYQVAQDLRVPLSSVTTLYTRLVPALKEYGMSSEAALDVTKSMGAALKVSGATGAETASVMLQFSQAMAAGRLNGAEFNAVAEGAPIILRMLSKELGVSRGELKKMAADGMLTSGIITNVLTAYREELEDQAKKIPDTVESAIGNLTNAFTRYFGKLNEATGFTKGLSAVIKSIADNIESLGKVVEFFAITTLALLITRLGAAALSMGVLSLAAGGLAKEMGIAAASTGILSTALNFLSKHPVIIGITALATGAYYLYDSFKDTKESAEDLDKSLADAQSIDDASKRFNSLSDEVEKTERSYYKAKSALEELQDVQRRNTPAQNAANDFGFGKSMNEKIAEATAEVNKYAKAWNNAKNAVAAHNAEVKQVGSKESPLEQEVKLLEVQAKLGVKWTKTQQDIYQMEEKIKGVSSAEGTKAKDKILEGLNNELGLLKRKEVAEKAIADANKANKASAREGESFAKKYAKQVESITLFVNKLNEELSLKRKLTDAEKEVLKIESFIESNKKNLSKSQLIELNTLKETVAHKGEEIRVRKLTNEFLDESQEKYLRNIELQQQEAEATFNSAKAIEEKIKLQDLANVGMQQTPLGTHLDQIEADKKRITFLKDQIGLMGEQLDLKIQLAWWTAFENGDEAGMERAEKAGKAIQDRIDKYENEIKVIQKSIDANGKLTDVLDKSAKISMLTIGNSPGKILAEGFGEAGQAISKMTEAYTKFGEEAAAVNKYVADKQRMLEASGMSKSDAKIAAEKDVADKRIQINASMFASMAGAAKGFFSENSKGYQTMAKAEKAFRVIELAMATKNAIAKMALMGDEIAAFLMGETAKQTAEETTTGLSIAQSFARGTAKAAEAVASAFAAPFPLNFAAGAAMIAIMAGLGYMVSGGGGSSAPSSADRQSSQGTGSVFGDNSAKSESITKALENISENSDVSLKYNEGMLNSLKNIEASLVGVSKLVIRSGIQGKLGSAEGMGTDTSNVVNKMFNPADISTTTSILFAPLAAIGKALFSVKKSVVDSGFVQNAQSFADVINQGLSIFGYQDIETKKKKFGKTKTSTETNLQELSGDLQYQFTNVVLSMGESLKEAAKVLKMDGDSFNETLTSFVVDIGRISIQGMNSEQIQETLTNVFSKLGDDMASSMMPWLTDFQNVGEGMLETLVRVSSTVATVDGIFDSIGQTMNVTGIAGIKAKMDLAELAGGLQELSGLVSNFYDKFYTSAEKQANTTRLVTEEFNKLGIQMLDLNASDARIKFRELVNSFRDSDQETYLRLLRLTDAVDSLAPSLEGAGNAADVLNQKLSLEGQLQQLTMSSVEYTALQRKKELDTIDASLRPLQERIWALEDEKVALENLKSSAHSAMSVLEKSVSAEKIALKKSLDNKVKDIDNLKAIENKRYEDERQAIQDSVDAQNALITAANQAKESQINSLNTQLTSIKESRDNLKSLFNSIDDSIRSLTDSVDGLQTASYGVAKASLDAALSAAKSTGVVPNAEEFKGTLSALSSISSSNFGSSFDFTKEKLVSAGKLFDLKSIVGGQLAGKDAVVAAIEANIKAIEVSKQDANISAASALSAAEEQHKVNIGKLDEQIKQLNLQYETDLEYLDSILLEARKQLEIAEGTYLETKGVKDAVNGFAGALTAYIAFKDAEHAAVVAQINQMAQSTIPTLTMIAERASQENADLKAEIIAMREESLAANKAIASNTLTTAKVLSQWDGDGQPEVRNVA